MERAVLSLVLSTVRDLLLEETRFLYGVRREVRVLETKLKEIQCLLDDAERRKHDNKISRNWITQIKDLAHRAEDVILTYSVQVSSRRGQRLKQRLHRFSCILCECCSLHQIGSEISEITSELDRVTKSMLSFGLRNIIEGESSTTNTTCSDNQRWKRLAFPVEKEDCFVGKEEELKRLLSLLTEDTQHLVIGLWGTGGIGKTTIARKVYNHTDVSSSFKCFAWVCITQQCEIRSVLEDVLKQLTQGKKDHISSLSDTELVVQLCKVQRSKRCMIVLDALWKIDHWTGLKHAFLIEGSNSKILLTTRNHDIATIGYAFEVGLLNMHDGWELLKKKAFPNSNSVPAEFADQESSLQKIGEEMVHRCSYLPLVISLLGGVLSTRTSIEEWELVKKNINVYLYKGKSIDKEKEIHEVLRLSYDDLPYYLKPCFLYMGQFLEGQTINVNVLCRRWIAQGMISHENRGNEETLMDTAELYLSELVSRCIVQVEVLEGIEGKKYIECRLHDVIRELCLSLGEEEEFGLKIFDYKGGRFSTLLHECLSGTSSKTRHLVMNFRAEMELEPDHGKFTISSDVVRYVRSLSFCVIPGWERLTDYGESPPIIFPLQKFKFLRELSFVNCRFPERHILMGIGDLIHLRHLQLHACELEELPSSISNLVYLCTLDFSFSSNIRVPNVLKKMNRLKHLVLPKYDLDKIGEYRLRLDEGLDELETLIGFDSLVHEFKSLTRLKNLRRVGVFVRDSESLSAIIDTITTTRENLRHSGLTIAQECKFTLEQEWISLRKVFTCSTLHQLKIDSRIGKLIENCRTQIISSKLQRLSLHECEIEDDPMKIFGKLPFLQQLRLLKTSFVGEQMECYASGFPRLKLLILSGLPNLREWRVEQEAMPLLSEIRMYHCPCLKVVPEGLRFVRGLQKLIISGMPELGSRVSPSQDDGVEGEDFHEVRHVPSVVVFDD